MTGQKPKRIGKAGSVRKGRFSAITKWVKKPISWIVALLLGGGVSLIAIHPTLFDISGSEFNININSKAEGDKLTSVPPLSSDSEENNASKIPSQPTSECFLNEANVPCDSPHNQEIIGQADNCSIETLITYLGGNSEYDTVSPTVSFSQKDGACIVSLNKEIDRKIEGSWREPNPILDPLRACYKGDQSSNLIGSCADPHVGEIVYSQKLDAADSMNCSNRAEEYMNSSIEKWSDEIDIREITSDNYRMCVAYTRDSSDLLTGLRNIKNQAITTQSN